MVLYWMYCGDIDLLDRIIFAELFALGACYALMALLASILHEDALGANPITVIRAIRRVGWGYWRPCLVCGARPDAGRHRPGGGLRGRQPRPGGAGVLAFLGLPPL